MLRRSPSERSGMSNSRLLATGFPIVYAWVLLLCLVQRMPLAFGQQPEAPRIIGHPDSQTASAGEDVRFIVTAQGTTPLSFQWQFRDEDIPGEDKPDLLLTGVQYENSGDYSVVVRNRYGEATSRPAFLRVISPPVIREQPGGVDGAVGQKVQFHVKAVGTPPLRYQWYRNQLPVLGMTNEFLLLATLSPNQAGDYFVHIKNDYGETESRFARLTVNEPPVILTQPISRTVQPGQTVTFSVEATGTSPLKYQWRLNGQNILQGTNSLLTVFGHPTNAGTYQVIVGNLVGTDTSDPAFLKLQLPEVPFADKLADSILVTNQTSCLNGHNFQATVDANEPLHGDVRGGSSVWIRWRALQRGIVRFSTRGSTFDTVLAAYTTGASGGALVRVASDDDQGGFYAGEIRFVANSNAIYYIAIDGVLGVEGQFALCWDFFVAPFDVLPTIQTQPADITATFGENVAFGVVAQAERYQWFFNGNRLTNETRATLVVSNVTPRSAGYYQVVAFLGNYAVTSRLATLQFSFLGADNYPTNAFARDKFSDVVILPLGGPGGAANMEVSMEAQSSPAGMSVVLGYTGTQIFNTYGSGTEAGEIAHCGIPGGASQWFVFQAPEDGTLHLNTAGSDFDTVLAVYEGPGPLLSSLTPVDCDNNSGPGVTSSLSLGAKGDSIYYIAVDGVDGVTGEAHLNYRLLIPITITRMAMPNPETYRFRVTATPSYPVSIERSGAMLTWLNLLTTNSPSGTFIFQDVNATGIKRFYRALQIP